MQKVTATAVPPYLGAVPHSSDQWDDELAHATFATQEPQVLRCTKDGRVVSAAAVEDAYDEVTRIAASCIQGSAWGLT